MDLQDKIYVAGHQGLVGSAILRRLQEEGYGNIVFKSHRELDLTRQSEVEAFFLAERPRYVFLGAARVGGILANTTYPAEFFYSKLAVALKVAHTCYLAGVKKLLFLGSSCIYPREAPQPIPEEALLTSPLEPTNEAYALAKIAGLKMCSHYNRQYGTDFLSVMPTNLYGPNDHYHPEKSHVLPALLRKFHEAKETGASEVLLWGSGSPLREFLYVDDLAEAVVFLMENFSAPDLGETINIGTGEEISIRDLAERVRRVVGFEGEISWDSTKPDGMPRKLLDVHRILSLGWSPKVSLSEGLERTYRDFKARWEAGTIVP